MKIQTTQNFDYSEFWNRTMLADLHYFIWSLTIKLSTQGGVILVKHIALSNQKLLDSYLVPCTKINSKSKIIMNDNLNYKTLAKKKKSSDFWLDKECSALTSRAG